MTASHCVPLRPDAVAFQRVATASHCVPPPVGGRRDAVAGRGPEAIEGEE